MLRVGSSLKGLKIEATDGSIGTVSDLLFDDRTWMLRWLVVDTGGWWSGHTVLIHPSAIGPVDTEARRIAVKLTQTQVRGSPDLLQDEPVSRQMEYNIYNYYQWDPHWGDHYFADGTIAFPAMPSPYFPGPGGREEADASSRLDEGDPHLRSISGVKGYHVHATDGTIGHLESFLIDDATWRIDYLIIDTRNWWTGQHVLLSPHAVKAISYTGRHIDVDVSQAKIKDGPPWVPTEVVDRPYQERLHLHYAWPGYGW